MGNTAVTVGIFCGATVATIRPLVVWFVRWRSGLPKFTPRASGLTGNRKPYARECALRYVILDSATATVSLNPAMCKIVYDRLGWDYLQGWTLLTAAAPHGEKG